MRSNFLLTSIVIFCFTGVYAQNDLSYRYDSLKKAVYYEKVFEYPNKSAAEIKNAVLKVMAAEMIHVNFSDDKDVYAVGDFVTLYKSGSYHADFKMSCKIHFALKDGKMKFRAENFLLRPKNVVSTSNSAFSTSTLKVPHEKPIEVYYPQRTSAKHKLFPDMNRIMNGLMSKISAELNSENNDW